MNRQISRRTLLTAMTAAATLRPAFTDTDSRIIENHDRSVDRLLDSQVTDPTSRWRGAAPDRNGLHQPGSAGGILETFTAAFFHPQSKYHQCNRLIERMKLAADFLIRSQSPQGNIDLLTTNFNSPPDTGFVVHKVAAAANLARLYEKEDLLAMMEPFLRNAGRGMAEGGVHTPNHRWVVCSALAQIHELFPDPSYIQRIDQWLAEGIDIDEEGQYTERSTTVYNAVTNRTLVVMAKKLNRPDLLEPVRCNLDAMLYLLHPDYEVVTEISRRQDINTRGTMAQYWFPLRYLANLNDNGCYATLVQHLEPQHARLATLMEYPELNQPLPKLIPIPDNYEKQYPLSKIARIRRGKTSATLLLGGNSRILALRHGAAVINAVRFASAFFGKGQFIPTTAEKRTGAFYFEQFLEAGYYQPLDPPRNVPARAWGAVRRERRQTEIARLHYSAVVTEMENGFKMHIRAEGTDNVPLAIEINLREGGKITGCQPAPDVEDAYLASSEQVTYQMGGDIIRIGPCLCENSYTQIRGAQPKLPGPSVYLTAYTPFDHTLTLEWA